MVFLYHNRKYWNSFIPETIMRFLNEFHTGVSLFFVLSGFLIAYTYHDKPLSSPREYRNYFLIRFFRIYPVYFLLLLAKYIDVGFPSTKESIYTLSLSHGFSDNYNLLGIPQSWSLTVEFSFYALAPFIYFLMKKNKVRTFLLLCLLAGLTIAVGYAWKKINGNPDWFFYDWFFVLNGTFTGRFFEFFSGMLLAWQLKRFSTTGSMPKYLTVIGGVATLACIYVISLFEKNFRHGTEDTWGLLIRNFIFPVTVCVFFLGLIKERTWAQRFLSSKVMVLMGNASFVFYLIHIGYFKNKLAGFFFLPDRNFTALWLISIVIFLLIEKPLYTFIKNRIKRQPFTKPAWVMSIAKIYAHPFFMRKH